MRVEGVLYEGWRMIGGGFGEDWRRVGVGLKEGWWVGGRFEDGCRRAGRRIERGMEGWL